MANIVVCAPLDGGQPAAAALSAVADARRVASVMGATVISLVVADGASPDEDQLGAALGRAGADKVLLVTTSGAAGTDPAAWHPALTLVSARFSPRLFLLPAGPLGDQLAPWLAEQRRGFHLPHAQLDVRAGNDAVPASVALRPVDRGEGPKDVDLAAAALPVVATVDAHELTASSGARPAEVALLAPTAIS